MRTEGFHTYKKAHVSPIFNTPRTIQTSKNHRPLLVIACHPRSIPNSPTTRLIAAVEQTWPPVGSAPTHPPYHLSKRCVSSIDRINWNREHDVDFFDASIFFHDTRQNRIPQGWCSNRSANLISISLRDKETSRRSSGGTFPHLSKQLADSST